MFEVITSLALEYLIDTHFIFSTPTFLKVLEAVKKAYQPTQAMAHVWKMASIQEAMDTCSMSLLLIPLLPSKLKSYLFS